MQQEPGIGNLPVLSPNAADIIDAVLNHDQRVLLFGPMGIGKSTLALQLASALAASDRSCYCLNADPGSPAFGPPGAVSLAAWQQARWQVTDYAALCTLDAGRFRLPLVTAARMLAARLPAGPALIDTPGVVRGVAGRELLHGLVEATAAEAVLALTAKHRSPPLLEELRALTAEVYVVHAVAAAKRPGKRARARQRTHRWDQTLAGSQEHALDLARMNITGTPPPTAETSAWQGKQVALLRADQTLAMGEVTAIQPDRLMVRLTQQASDADTLLIRDAVRTVDGWIETAAPFAAERLDYLPPADVLPSLSTDTGPRVVGRVGALDIALVNGIFGDPLLHLRLRHQRRSLLFDLGSGDRLPARIAHQVTDVFISHAHMDHISGFLWLLRSRIGAYPACRLYGPPGLAVHIGGFLQAILWDRVQNNAPVFVVHELHGDSLKRFRLVAGGTQPEFLDDKPLVDNAILCEAGFTVRGITLDHRGTAVIAFAFVAAPQLNIRKDRLEARGLKPGPWLNALKSNLLMKQQNATIPLPDGSRARVGSLADDLVLITPGKTLVYATDLADTADNRTRLVELARHAHTFFCESSYSEADAEYAAMNGHLTTRACGEIASAAGVSRLVPFHFSRRYQHRAEQLYQEIDSYCSRLCRPRTTVVRDRDDAAQATVELD